MNKQFTPGKWKVDPNYPGDILRENGRDIVTTIRHLGAKREIPPIENGVGIDEAKANARLISAAPCMFELLEDIAYCGVIRIEEIKQLLAKITTP